MHLHQFKVTVKKEVCMYITVALKKVLRLVAVVYHYPPKPHPPTFFFPQAYTNLGKNLLSCPDEFEPLTTPAEAAAVRSEEFREDDNFPSWLSCFEFVSITKLDLFDTPFSVFSVILGFAFPPMGCSLFFEES